MEYFPPAFVVVPEAVPLTETLTPDKGALVLLDVTVPVTSCACAKVFIFWPSTTFEPVPVI